MLCLESIQPYKQVTVVIKYSESSWDPSFNQIVDSERPDVFPQRKNKYVRNTLQSQSPILLTTKKKSRLFQLL